MPNGSVGFRWGEKGKWNLEEKERGRSRDQPAADASPTIKDELADVAFPYFGNREHDHFAGTDHPSVLVRNVPAKRVKLKDGEALVASVFDLFVANYGVDRGFGGEHVAKSYDENVPYTPAWAEKITGVPRDQIIQVAREFARNAEKTKGRSMVIIGAAMNHWFHCDMNYRGVINMLVMCGCVGQSGGGWSHYVGQEKLRPQIGLAAAGLRARLEPAAAAAELDLVLLRPHRPVALRDAGRRRDRLADCAGRALGRRADRLQRARRAHGLAAVRAAARDQSARGRPSRPRRRARKPKDYVAGALKSGELKLSCHDPDNPKNWPRNMFVWRSNLLGSSGKGHEYFLKHLLGTSHGVMGKQLGEMGAQKPSDVVWHDEAPEGKLDLLVTLDFRMSTTCVYSDIVLPTATWYEKNDLNTSDMHPFIHPLTGAVDPAWEARSDWEIYKAHRQEVLRGRAGGAGRREGRGAHAHPARHAGRDRAGARRQGLEARRVRAGPRQDHAGGHRGRARLSQPLQALHRRSGRCMSKLGNGGKGMAWNTEHEVDFLKRLNGVVTDEGPTKGLPKIETDIDAAEVILTLAPETNGEVAVKAWESLGEIHRPRAHPSRHPEGGREDPLPRRGRAAAQDHLLADLVGHREREGLLQRRLHQRARADPLAHAHRPPAALPGPPVDARLRRGAVRLPAADRHALGQAGDRHQAQRQEADRPQLHHAAPEVGHPLHLHRQPADAHA